MHASRLPRKISIVYRRLPDQIREYEGILRRATARSLIIESRLNMSNPIRLGGKVIADTGYLAIWFIFKNRWYDVGKFYDRLGTFLGYYCDIIEPVAQLFSSCSRTGTLTDLCLDLWISATNQFCVLDEDEFEGALRRGFISKETAQRARWQLNSLVRMLQERRFPSRTVRETDPMSKSK